MKSCRVKALEYIIEEEKEDISSNIKMFLILGFVLLIITSVLLFSMKNSNYADKMGYILYTLFFLSINLIIYAIILKYRQNLFEQEISEKNSLLNKMYKINEFASEDKDVISYYDVSKNVNGLNFILLPIMMTCTYYSINTQFFIIEILLLVLSAVLITLCPCFPDKLEGYLGGDVRSSEGFKKLFIMSHLSIINTLIIIILSVF